jgi:hypothetical protein
MTQMELYSVAKHRNNPQYCDLNSAPSGSRVSSLRDGQDDRKPPQDIYLQSINWGRNCGLLVTPRTLDCLCLGLDGLLTEFFEIDSWRLVGCTPSLHDHVIKGPCGVRFGIWLGLLLWNGQDSYAAIGKGSVSKDKDSSGAHVFDPKR